MLKKLYLATIQHKNSKCFPANEIPEINRCRGLLSTLTQVEVEDPYIANGDLVSLLCRGGPR